ncbi:MAG: Hsp70 family protein, partial [Planctomycetota bacterium]
RARELTREAALTAGLPEETILLEEPQAALYAWIAERGERWRNELRVDDVVLVCDVGGGTTDFSLIGVAAEGGELVLRRLAVGNHILVGGDNMDLTLSHLVRSRFEERGVSLDPWQAVSLWHACRTAKEHLLTDGGPAAWPVSVLGRGSRLVGGTISVDVAREEVLTALLEGFFPVCDEGARPARRGASGFRELGLPFASDTGITRHLAEFLSAHAGRSHGGASGAVGGRAPSAPYGAPDHPVSPTHVLFNGGVFKPSVFRQRTLDVLESWSGRSGSVRLLEQSPDLDFAVARGAAYYGFAKRRSGVRIRGGTGRSYYVGIETAGPAVPGVSRPLSALCVVPFGMEEGSEIEVPSEEIGLVVGERAQFRFFSSSMRRDDKPGDIVAGGAASGILETDSLEAHLPADERFAEGCVPVKFRSRITELGVFELWCRSTISEDTWRLEFSVRQRAEGSGADSSSR